MNGKKSIWRTSFLKDIVREIKTSFGRYLGIVLIIAIGVAFYAGVRATGYDMRLTADDYYDKQNLPDIRILSTFGINSDDIEAVAKEVDYVEGNYTVDFILQLEERDIVVKAFSHSFGKSIMNKPVVTKGELPKAANECVVETGFLRRNELSIGDTITLKSGTSDPISDTLSITEFKVVGEVDSPTYISKERGTASIGTGSVDGIIMLPEESFELTVFTDLYIKIDNDYNTYDDAYKDLIELHKSSIEKIAERRTQERYDEILSEAFAEIEEAKAELKDGEEQFLTEIADAQAKIDEAKQEIADGENEIKENEEKLINEIADAREKIEDAKAKIEDGKKEIEQKQAELEDAQNKIDDGIAQIVANQSELKDSEQQLKQLKQQIDEINAVLSQYNTTYDQQYYELQATANAMQGSYDEGMTKLSEGKQQIAAALNELETNQLTIDEGKIKLEEAKIELISNEDAIPENEQKIENEEQDGYRKLADAKKELEEGKAELLSKELEFEDGRLEGEQELADARKEIEDAEKEISEIKKPKWYVLTREANPGYVSYSYDTQRIEAVGQLFPFIFFLVAALVCLTTITRMAEEQRGQIGTLKALGYGKPSIAFKYIAYSVSAALFGCILGVLTGMKIFPIAIFSAYKSLYILPKLIAPYEVFYSLTSAIAAVVIILAATLYGVGKEIRSVPAELIRPKAPKTGKRTLLERVRFVWRRLSFIQKITARNIFRYKNRFFMTVIGIGGCTALVLVGFGILDSVLGIPKLQFENIIKYDVRVELKDIDDSIIDAVLSNPKVKSGMPTREQTVTVSSSQGRDARLVVPQADDNFADYISLQQTSTQKKLPLPDDGAIITEKLAKLLNVAIGDALEISFDNNIYSILIKGIAENYFYHYIYMSSNYYEDIFNTKFEPTEILLNMNTLDEDEAFASEILKHDSVSSVDFTKNSSISFFDSLSSMKLVIVVLIVSAGFLAFVVLANLTNINITERTRELATLKVLGFYSPEISSYVHRENILLTIIGALIGLVMGYFIHQGVMATVEIDLVMFQRHIKPISYVYSTLLTILFSVTVNLYTTRRLKKINMVEALKSVE